MASGKFVSYLRVSTQGQGKSGLGLEAQRTAVADYLNGGDWSLHGEFVEVESGKRNDRPKLAEALALAKRECATLLIAKLDRLARNVAFIANLLEAGVEVVACDMPTANKFMLHVMAAVAEQEAKATSDRTKAALAAAKARGAKLGWANPDRSTELQRALAKSACSRKKASSEYASSVMPHIAEIRLSGITSFAGIATALNAQRVLTARNKLWHATSVSRVLCLSAQSTSKLSQ